jgi:hypothetical protein
MSNQARKVNGDLFERLIKLVLQETGFDCVGGITRVPLRGKNSDVATFMNYQHDLLLRQEGELKIIGSVKTTSKDRIDKIFVDKFLYNKLTKTSTPHIAIVLNDVQRKSGKNQGKYGVSNTFLPGHFHGYTVSLNPLDGVYYCDILDAILADPFTNERISTIDRFFFDDLRPLLSRRGESLSGAVIEDDRN